MWWLVALWLVQSGAMTPALPPVTGPPLVQVGAVVPSVTCLTDSTQSYALYLPSSYSPDKAWPVIFAFDPGARGSTPVERYRIAAEKYGYIIAGSNNSRNGMPNVTPAINAMTTDVASRFHIDSKRIYVAGMSGGARLALAVASSSTGIAGVFASSAAFPDSVPRKKVPFAIFATAGTEDFNHLELRELDRELTSPHHLTVFEGGHVWLSSALAVEAVEWMDLMAMKSGAAERNPAKLEAIFTTRVSAARARPERKDRYLDLQSIAADFDGLKDVSAIAAEASELAKDSKVRDAIKRDRDIDVRERSLLIEIFQMGQRLATDERDDALADLRRAWGALSQQAQKPADSPERRLARRVLSGLAASVRTDDTEYQKIIAQYRLARR